MNLTGIEICYNCMCPLSANSSIRHYGKINFRLKSWTIHQIARFQVWIFKIFWGGAQQALSQFPQLAQTRASVSIRASTSNLGRFAPSVWASPSMHPNMLDHLTNVCSGSIVVTTLDCELRGSWFESRVGVNILWGSIDCTGLTRAFIPSG